MISELTFNLTPQEIEHLQTQQFQVLSAELERIAKAKTSNALLALENALANFSNSLGVAIFLKYVSSDEAVREASDRLETAVQKLMVDIFAREDLFKAIKLCEKETRLLGKVQTELLDEYLFNFRRNGLELSESERRVYLDKKKRLVEVEAEFSQNLLKENTVLEFSSEELDGLPQSFINSLERSSHGKYLVTLAYPHVNPFMENVKSNSARKKLSFYFNNRGGPANKQLLEEALGLRHELATQLGYSSHCHLVLSRRMAQTPQEVQKFLADLATKLEPIGKRERAELMEVKKKELKDSTPLASFEWRYLHNSLMREKFQIDPLVIQEYFPLNTVLQGMFDIYETLLGVRFEEDTQATTWHPSVRKFTVLRGGKVASHFYMDLFPRKGKYSHAAAFTLITAYQLKDGTYQVPFSSIVANFSSPSQHRPSLLLHTEVETLFHEFGHIMHQVLTKAHFPSFSGTSVKTDFVEAPSQMLENWVWDKKILSKISGHYARANEPIPSEMVDKMLAAKTLNQGLHYLRQVAFASIDLELHSQPQSDSSSVYNKWIQTLLGIPVLEGTCPQASFGHLMGGYDAGYYGYLWSEVFAQDMFTRFEKEGLLNPQTGREYREWILEPGGEKPPMDLIRGFLKREPNSDAFLKSLGV
ncbi:MAG: hypothetical protein EBQ85_09970 [Proteobacteria bacterium]|nr:hypothetical protein [Pseudomonadota bacterium]